jgi:hypothetical protein
MARARDVDPSLIKYVVARACTYARTDAPSFDPANRPSSSSLDQQPGFLIEPSTIPWQPGGSGSPGDKEEDARDDDGSVVQLERWLR